MTGQRGGLWRQRDFGLFWAGESVSEVAQTGGPGLGGLIAQVAGPATGLLADAVSSGVSFACLTALRSPRQRRTNATGLRRGSLAREALDGLLLLWYDRYLRPIAILAALANLALTGMDALIIVFLVRSIGLRAAAAGLIVAAFGIGGVAGAFVARPLGRRIGTARAMLAGSAALSLALLLPLAQAGPSLAFAVIANIFIAGGVVVGNVLGASFRQAYVPPEMLGRVSSATMTVAYAMMPAGALLAGALATTLGVRTTMWILTALISSSGLLYLTTPLRHLRDFPRRPQTPANPEVPIHVNLLGL
jgi:predicted MFS family arabinose efflux permease